MKTDAIYRVTRTRIESLEDGVSIYMEVIVVYGFNVIDSLRKFKEKCRKEIEKLTSMNVKNIRVVAKGLHIPEKE